jgi:hypothetical protein
MILHCLRHAYHGRRWPCFHWSFEAAVEIPLPGFSEAG